MLKSFVSHGISANHVNFSSVAVSSLDVWNKCHLAVGINLSSSPVQSGSWNKGHLVTWKIYQLFIGGKTYGQFLT
jgi:hypothetical protein